MKIIIKQKDAGKRLDVFLAGKVKNKSRSQLQKMIKDGGFLVNEKMATPHYGLREGDVVGQVLEAKKRAIVSSKQAQGELTANSKTGFDLEKIIVEENKDYLVINKPAGLIVHGGGHIKESALTDMLVKKYRSLKTVGEDASRPGIVHRLDKEASGLMVVPRNQKAFEYFKKLFKDRKISKKYSALVYGQIAKEEDNINFPIKRASGGYKMAAIPLTHKKEQASLEIFPEARVAETHFEIAKKFINYTLLKVAIKTGRTHQIRCHLSAYGHSIVGDDLYSTKKTREQNKKNALGRIFLVADELSFIDPSGESKKYKIGLPKELKSFLDKVK